MIPAVSEALLIVDYQNDFAAPGGALSVEGGEDIAERINQLAKAGGYDLVIATRDWHPAGHSSFTEQGGVWPVHCVQGTPGAELHPALDREDVDIVFDKGTDQSTDGYSAFETGELAQILRDRDIDKLTVVGLATDYCVKNSAIDAEHDGFQVRVDTSAVRGVDVKPGDSDRALAELREAGVEVT
jgi:nicotinamidase/pyrazinamidase